MIISLSGSAGSGKDAVGKIIQYLTCSKSLGTNELPTKEELAIYVKNGILYCDFQYSWQIKKWAYKLKEIASLLTGVSRDKWEEEEFKNSYMPEMWNKWFISTDLRRNKRGRFYNSFEEAWVPYRDWMIKNQKISKKLATTNAKHETSLIAITYRQFLQWLGTEAIRDGLHKDAWVNGLMSEYTGWLSYRGYVAKEEREECYPQNWIITDTRFHNELQAIKDRGGICIRVNRDIYPIYNDSQVVDKLTAMGYFVDKDEFVEIALNEGFDWNDDKEYWTLDSDLPVDNDMHPSEREWRDWKFDYVIDNNGTLEDLIIEVEKMLKHFKLL